MKLKVLLKDGWAEVTPKSKNGVITVEDALNHLEIAGYNLDELDCTEYPDRIKWSCNCCGEGHISQVLKDYGYSVTSRDLINRGYGEVADFLNKSNQEWCGDIITNPPYKFAKEFVEKSLDIVPEGHKVAMFLKLTFLEGKGRKEMFQNNPPKIVYVSSSRLKCAKNGDFDNAPGSATAYAWYVWEKGYKGDTVIKWLN